MTWRDRQNAFYKSGAWHRCKAYVWRRAGGLCERCRDKGLIVAADVVHHIDPITPANINDPRITLNPANLMCLCARCHAEVHSGKRWSVDPNGRLVAPIGALETR